MFRSEHPDDELSCALTATAGEHDKKKTRKLHLKRKHRVDPLRAEEGQAESPTPPPPPGQSEPLGFGAGCYRHLPVPIF